MTNQDLIDAVKAHQSNKYVHPLTCGVDSRHEILVAEEREGKVVLTCPTCGWVQGYMPTFLTMKLP